MSLSQGQKCLCRPSWSSYNLQFFVTATVPSVDIALMVHRLFCCKISQWMILWAWDPLFSVGGRKSPSAGDPLNSIKSVIPLSLNTCEQVNQIFCLHFLHRWPIWFNFVYPRLPDLQPKASYSKLRLFYAHSERPTELVQSFILCLSFLRASAAFVSIRPGTWDKAAACASNTCASISILLPRQLPVPLRKTMLSMSCFCAKMK